MERLTRSNEEIKTLQVENEEYWLKVYFKLKEYEDLEEQGLLIRLPVAVGQVVYEICNDCLNKKDICPEDTDEDSCFGCRFHTWKISKTHFKTKKQIINRMHEIGRTIFLTKEEAEAALERIGD